MTEVGSSVRPLGEVAQFINGGAWSQNEYSSNGIPVVQVSNIRGNQIDLTDCKYLPNTSVEKYGRHLIRRDDLIIATVGSHPSQPNSVVGRPVIARSNAVNALLNQNAVIVRSMCDDVDQKWLGWLGRDRSFRDYIISCARGSANQVRMAIGLLKQMPINIPPLETQRRIAEILGAYDDLLEVNRRRIAVLEEMAQGLFTEWFIRMRFPGHEDVVIEDTPNGPLPAGWRTCCVENFGDVITGKTPSKAEPLFAGRDIPFVKIPDMHGTMFLHHTGEMLSEKGAASQSNKTVPAGAVCVSCIGTIGLVGITACPCQTNQQINTVIPHTAEVTEFLYFSFLRSKSDLVNLGSNGATMGNVNKRKFSEMKLMCPPQVLMKEFHRRTSPAIELVRVLEVSNLRLSAARDLLLPRLISGQLSVTQAEQELEAI